MTRQQRYKETHPWVRYVEYARRRCSDASSRWWPFYGARGIRCTLNAEQLREIWFRDKAYALKKPSLDRIDSNGNYELSNVRFIEQAQ
ncbi:MAG: hypothetical protein KGL04_10200, partial [Elusimicrobia bacterium]|nr:hypothetical protein [Elusimicrobiota bacterium]